MYMLSPATINGLGAGRPVFGVGHGESLHPPKIKRYQRPDSSVMTNHGLSSN